MGKRHRPFFELNKLQVLLPIIRATWTRQEIGIQINLLTTRSIQFAISCDAMGTLKTTFKGRAQHYDDDLVIPHFDTKLLRRH